MDEPDGEGPAKTMAEKIPGDFGAGQVIAACVASRTVSTKRGMAKTVRR
jgi:hypothetical protein